MEEKELYEDIEILGDALLGLEKISDKEIFEYTQRKIARTTLQWNGLTADDIVGILKDKELGGFNGDQSATISAIIIMASGGTHDIELLNTNIIEAASEIWPKEIRGEHKLKFHKQNHQSFLSMLKNEKKELNDKLEFGSIVKGHYRSHIKLSSNF